MTCSARSGKAQTLGVGEPRRCGATVLPLYASWRFVSPLPCDEDKGLDGQTERLTTRWAPK